MEKMDLGQASASDLQPDSHDSVELTLDLGELTLTDQEEESFDDLIRQQKYKSGNLFPLHKCRLALRDNGTLRLYNLHPGAGDPRYQDLQQLLLRLAGFHDATVSGSEPPFLVEARKRPAVVEEQEYGMVVREVVTPQEVAAAHEFARTYYFYKDFNYDLEVARQFDLHTYVFAVYDKSSQMVALSRTAVRVPGYSCPFQYAVSDVGTHFRVPRHHKVIGEVMAIYKEGRDGVFAYKRLMEFLVHHIPLLCWPSSIWTTYEVNDPFTGNLYRNKFMMEDVGTRLTYRDFGGKWILLCTEKIQELHQLHRNLFRQ